MPFDFLLLLKTGHFEYYSSITWDTRFSSPHGLLLSLEGCSYLFSKVFLQGLFSLSWVVTEILLSWCLAVMLQISLANVSRKEKSNLLVFIDCLLANRLLQRLTRLPVALP